MSTNTTRPAWEYHPTGENKRTRVFPRRKSFGAVWGLGCLALLVLPHLTVGLTEADQRTLNRLQEQAEQAMGQGDPNGAALTIGKAALLASQIGRKSPDEVQGHVEEALASFYRTQEHTYRAIALFEQSGSQTPASSGVCQTIAQGIAQSAHSKTLLKGQTPERPSQPPLSRQIRDWERTLQEIEKEFGCSEVNTGTRIGPVPKN